MAKRKDLVARYDHMTKTAKTVDEATSHRERVWFDYFNPNGAYAIYQEAYDRLMVAVSDPTNGLKPGALIAYSADRYVNKLSHIVRRKSNPSQFESYYYAKELIATSRKIENVIFDAYRRANHR
jgi:hypothetical protein